MSLICKKICGIDNIRSETFFKIAMFKRHITEIDILSSEVYLKKIPLHIYVKPGFRTRNRYLICIQYGDILEESNKLSLIWQGAKLFDKILKIGSEKFLKIIERRFSN